MIEILNLDSLFPKHGGNLISEARRLGFQKDQVIDASASIVPFGPPKLLVDSLKKAISSSSIRAYPDCSHQQLREAIGAFHQVDPEMILPGNGAAELFTWAARDASHQGTSCLPVPGFADYLRALQCWGAKFNFQHLPLSWPLAKPQPFPIQTTADVLWITNPHNPTGQLWSKDSLEPLLKKHSLVICDEAFLSLVPNGEKQSLIQLVFKHPNLIVIRSLTKLFGIAGLRIGYAVSMPNRLKKWQEWRDPWPVNGLATEAGVLIMNENEFLTQWLCDIHEWVIKEGSLFYSKLQTLPRIEPHSSAANFLLIESPHSLMTLREDLAHRKILVRECKSFLGLGENWLRISLQTKENNDKIFNLMKELLS